MSITVMKKSRPGDWRFSDLSPDTRGGSGRDSASLTAVQGESPQVQDLWSCVLSQLYTLCPRNICRWRIGIYTEKI